MAGTGAVRPLQGLRLGLKAPVVDGDSGLLRACRDGRVRQRSGEVSMPVES
jgi:hypothetical protein